MSIKVTKTVTVREDLDAVATLVAKSTLRRLILEVGLPKAQELAPGRELPHKISAGPVEVVRNGVYRVSLKFPSKYAPVEFGSLGHEGLVIKPRRYRHLGTNIGYRQFVRFKGQRAQHFALRALKEVQKAFPGEFRRDLNGVLARNRTR